MDKSRIFFMETGAKNYGINVVLNENEYSLLKKRLKTALSKHSSSSKTRLLSKIIEGSIPQLAFFIGEQTNEFFIWARTRGFKEKNESVKFLINTERIDGSYSSRSLLHLYSEVMALEKEIKKESVFLSDAKMKSVDEMKRQRDNLMIEFLDQIDYFRFLDILYLASLTYLTDSIFKKAIEANGSLGSKLIVVYSDILTSFIEKQWWSFHHGDEKVIPPEIRQLIDAISVFFIRLYYFRENSQTALRVMDKKSVFKVDVLETLKNIEVKRIEKFTDLATIISKSALFEITPHSIEMLFIKLAGKIGYHLFIEKSLTRAIAFFAFVAKPNSLFNDGIINQELQERLEQLILNEQRNINWK